VWLAFAFAATALQAGLRWLGADLAAPPVAAALLAGAGAYQFSALKHACLAKCRRPLPYFMAHWTEKPWGVFCMGLRQGALCLGCCWALMLLALAAGFMNVAWMAAIGVLMALEKTLPAPKLLTQGLGFGLTAAAAAVLMSNYGG
jgi:predicted metal-binding membrane protein